MDPKQKIRSRKLIGYWMSELKTQKLNWCEFGQVCRSAGYELVKLDLSQNLEDQGPFSVIIHKLTDIIARAHQNDAKCALMIENLERYVSSHPEVVIIDPLDNVRNLLDRYKTYSIIGDSDLKNIDVSTPSFVELRSTDLETNLSALRSARVQFPFICKPLVAAGSDCHQMAIVFNERGVKDCRVPCVAHTVVNHSAVLYKLYVVDKEYRVMTRRSVKNLYPSPDQETIHFHTHDVSKENSVSSLSEPEEGSWGREGGRPVNPLILDSIVRILGAHLGMCLLGIDVVVEDTTGRHAVIDINPYPGYYGYPGFFDSLLRCIENQMERKRECAVGSALASTPTVLSPSSEQVDSGFETADSSDERKKTDTRPQT